LSEQPEDVRKALRVIYRTRPVPAHAVCVHPRVPEPVREAVREAFIRMGREPRGRRLLAGVPMTVPGVAELADYQSLQRLGLERFYERP
jgi:ABC-type phosphate/phosphonate transport system substrate-binding protein